MFPSGNKKTFVSVLVLLLLQDIYFDSNFFFSRRFRYMLSSSLLLVIAFLSTSRYFSFQCFSLIMQLSMCESANLFYRPKGCKKSIMVFTTVNIRLCQRYCLFNTWSPNRMSDFDSQRLSQSIAYI